MLEIAKSKIASDKNSLVSENIKSLVNKILAVYHADASRVIADYRAEKQYTADYDGRQILELLQNADDAETDAIYIEINTVIKTLTISNNGIPFSLNGVKSLMLANMSPKNKKEYIGNKGLGFRSILNWVNQVDVITKETALQFSEQFAKEKYIEVLKDNLDLIYQVENDETLEKGEVPFAVLAIPDVKKVEVEGKWITTIKLHYKKDEENSILTQLGTIQEETLLFLKHTNNITILKNGEAPRVYEKSFPSEDKIQVNEKIWNIFNSGERAYDATKMYSYQIAWQDDLSDEDAVFYTYFPTNVKTHLPCLIHATFDLNASRKEINPSSENLYILNEIVEALAGIATNRFSHELSSWKPFQFLYPIYKSDNKVLSQFNQKLDELRKDLPIYPSTDGLYYEKERINNYENHFSIWVEKNLLGMHFYQLVKPIDEGTNIPYIDYSSPGYSTEEFIQIVNNINHELKDHNERARFIKMLLDKRFENIQKSSVYLPLLIDRETKKPTADQLFTILKEDKASINPPNFVRGMSFIDPDFYAILIGVLHEEIEKVRIEKENVSRPLKRVVDKIVNIGSNDIIDVIRYVVKETEGKIKQPGIVVNTQIKSLVDFLFMVFTQNSDRKGVLPLSIPLLNRNNEVVLSEDLFFGKKFEGGEIVELIFDGIYKDNKYLISNDFWQLTYENEVELFSFFSWLGVNKYIQFTVSDSDENANNEYLNFVFDTIEKPKLGNNFKFNGRKIKNIEEVKQLSHEKLVALIHYEKNLLSQLELGCDRLTWSYSNSKDHLLINNPSYISFQLRKHFQFRKVLIENDFGSGEQFQIFNFDDEVFQLNNTVSRIELNHLLEKLGAIVSFHHIHPSQIYEILKVHHLDFDQGKKSQSFYEKMLEYYVTNKKTQFINYTPNYDGLKFFARKGGKGNDFEQHLANEIYYSDNKLLPDSILEDYWFINLPKRMGEQNVQHFFGVNLIKDLVSTIKLSNPRENKDLTHELKSWLESIKVYLLCYRLISLKSETDFKAAAKKIKDLKINILNSCEFSLGEGKTHELDVNSFIKFEDTFFIKNNRATNLESLQKDALFSDAIAEIICIVFEVKDNKNKYRSIFKDDISDTKHLIIEDEHTKKLDKAFELLGVSKPELDFWSYVLKYNKKELPEQVSNYVELKKLIKDSLNFELSKDYSKIAFDDFSSQHAFNLLVSLIVEKQKVTYNHIIDYKPVLEGLFKYHSNKLEEVINLKLNLDKITQFVWTKLSTSTIEKKKKLNTEIIKLKQKISDDLNTQIKTIYIKQLKLDYDVLFSEHIKSFYDTNKTVDLKKIYDTNLIKLGNPIISDLEDELKNLFYFEWKVIEELQSIAFPEVATETATTELDDSDLDDVEIVESTTNAAVVNENNGEKSSVTGGGAHSQGHEKSKRRKGKAAEKLVRDKLVSLGYKNVCWVSGNSDEPVRDDSLGYDIRYTDKKGKEIFLEVKAISSDNSFFISENEKKCGLKHSEKYVMALVIDKKIHFIKDFFKFDKGESFDSNKKYTVKRNNYKVHFMVENKD